MVEGLILNSILGGVTGYITNNMAIKMLFHKYWGVGGVIEKEYQKFIQNFSQLIERDLVNHDTLQSEIKSPQFKKVVEDIVKTILSRELPEISGGKRVAEIDGYGESREKMEKYLKNYLLPSLLPRIKERVGEVKLYQLVSVEQYAHFSTQFQLFFQQKRWGEIIGEVIYKEVEEKRLGELFSPHFFTQLAENFCRIVEDVNFRKFDRELETFFWQMVEEMEIEIILRSMEEEIGEREIGNFIPDTGKLSRELIVRFLEIVEKEPEILEKLIEVSLELLKGVDLRLENILNWESRRRLFQFLEREFPVFLKDLIYFIEKNRLEIEAEINSTIEQILSEAGLGWKIVNNIMKVFTENFARSYGVVGKIKDIVREYGEEAGEELSGKIGKFLTSRTLGEIVELIEKNGEIERSLAKILSKNFITFLNSREVEIAEEFFSRKVRKIGEVKLDFLKEIVAPKGLLLIKERCIYTSQFKSLLQKGVKKGGEKIGLGRVGDYLEKFPGEIGGDISSYYYPLLNRKIGVSIPIPPEILGYLEWGEQIGATPLNLFYSKLYPYSSQIGGFLVESLAENLRTILKGKVSRAVERELSKFSPAEIREMVEQFMGKELKPITIFGAILGSLGGAGYYLATLPFANPYFSYFTPLVYGVTGVFTNHLAINMLFRPYEKKWYLPYFSPGVVVKQRPKLAKNISNFVKRGILTDEALQSLFLTQKRGWKKGVIENFQLENFKILEQFFQKNREKIVESLWKLLEKWVESNRGKLAEVGVQFLEENRNFIIESLRGELGKKVVNFLFQMEWGEVIGSKVRNYPLSNFIPVTRRVVEGEEKRVIKKVGEELQFEKIFPVLLQWEGDYQKFIREKSVGELIPPKTKEKIAKILAERFVAGAGGAKIIKKIVERIEKETFDSNLPIGELFGGKFREILKENVDFIVEQMVSSLDSRRGEIKEMAVKQLPWGTGWILKRRVEEVVDEIFNHTLPSFLERKKWEIYKLLEKLLNYRLKDMGIGERVWEAEKMENFILEITQNPNFYIGVERGINRVLELLFSFPLERGLEILNLHTLQNFLKVFSPTLQTGFATFISQLETKEETISKLIGELVEKILEKVLEGRKFGELLEKTQFEKELEKVIETLSQNPLFRQKLETLMEQFFLQFFQTEFYNPHLLRRDLEKFIGEFFPTLKKPIKGEMGKIISNLNHLLTPSFKREIGEYLVESSFRGVEKKLPQLVKAVDIQKIVYREITQMDPREIEKMFYSFADNYFRKLKLYGGFGAIFGIPSVVI